MPHLPHPENLTDFLAGCVERHGPRELFGTRTASGWQWITYAQLYARVGALRAALHARGVKRGDRVAVISRNRLEWVVAAHATYGLGATWVPMYEAQRAATWEEVLRDCGAKLCFAGSPAIRSQLEQMRGRLPALAQVLTFDGAASEPDSCAALLAQGAPAVEPVRAAPEEIATLIYTSGTTGAAKGVMLSHRNVLSNMLDASGHFEVGPEDRALSFLPWAHVFGGCSELLGMMAYGGSLAICEQPEQMVSAVLEVRPTFLFTVPRIWTRIYDGVRQKMAAAPAPIRGLFSRGLELAARRREGKPLSALQRATLALADKVVFSKVRAKLGGRLRYALCGSAAMPPEVGAFLEDLGIRVYMGYGMTEAGGVATENRQDAFRLGSAGKPVRNVRVELDFHAPGATAEHGEIILHGPGVMAGYFEKPELTRRALTPEGGLRSGDLGRFDADGFLWITGRIKEQYKLDNGKYVSPTALEEKLCLGRYVAQVMVHGANLPHNLALVVPNWPALQSALPQAAGAPAELVRDAKVRALIRDELEALSRDFRPYERVQDFALLEEAFSIENGQLSPTLKLVRPNILERYGQVLEALRARPSP